MPLPTAPAPWTFYRLGPTNEKELFKRRRETYEGVVVPAHIASYYSAFSAEFIGGLGKPYFIDPMTYVFAQDPSHLRRFKKDKTGRTLRDSLNQKIKGDIKRSYTKLITEYGGVVETSITEGRRLTPSDLTDAENAQTLVTKVVDFQLQRLASIPAKYKKYAKYAKQGQIMAGQNPPMMVLPPYFLTTTIGLDSWHTINLDLAARTKELVTDVPVFGVVFCSVELMRRDGEQIIEDFRQLELDGFVVWVDGFSGVQSYEHLKSVRDFISALSQVGRPIISLYGDAFSLVLSYSGLSGYCCGICYGEKKSSDQDADVEGGLPPRYYLSLLKKKVQIETELRRIPLANYAELACDCEMCRRRVDRALLEDFEAREHFMLARLREVNTIRSGQSANDLAQEMSAVFKKFNQQALIGPVPHLSNWARVLTERLRRE
jgi:hypothetical protein